MAPDAIDQTAEEMQVILDALEANRDPDDNEIEAYARMKNRVAGEMDALRARVMVEHAKLEENCIRMENELRNHDKAIEWKYGQMIAGLVKAKIAGKKLRSYKTLFGTVGYRKSSTAEKRRWKEKFTPAERVAWAKEHSPDAVDSETVDSVDKDKLPVTSELIWVEGATSSDAFYWAPAKEKKQEEKKDA